MFFSQKSDSQESGIWQIIDIKQWSQDLGLYNLSFARYSEKCYTGKFMELCKETPLVPMGINKAVVHTWIYKLY